MGNITSISAIHGESKTIIKQIYELNQEGLSELYNTLQNKISFTVENSFDNYDSSTDLFHSAHLSEQMLNKLYENQQQIVQNAKEHHMNRINLVSIFLNKLKLLYNEKKKESVPKQAPAPMQVPAPMQAELTEAVARKIFKFPTQGKIDTNALKKEYRRLALQYHPDRQTGNTHKFNVLTDAYDLLSELAKNREQDKDYMTLKQNSRQYEKKQRSKNTKNTKMNGKFDVKIFNEIYKESRMEEPEDKGYRSWLKDDNIPQINDSEIQQKLAGNSSGTKFNEVFDSYIPVKKETDAIIKYEGPKALYHGGESAGQLGNKNIKSREDIKEAHSGERTIDPNAIETYNHKNVDNLKKDRSNIKNYTNDEWSHYQQALKQKDEMETRRVQEVEKQDNLHGKRYDSIHSRMLENVWRS